MKYEKIIFRITKKILKFLFSKEYYSYQLKKGLSNEFNSNQRCFNIFKDYLDT